MRIGKVYHLKTAVQVFVMSEGKLTSLYSATRGPLSMSFDLVILNHGQVTRTAPEPASPSPSHLFTPSKGHSSSRQI
ncbi:hypothetical protein TNCV_1054921 [Trichonephila clavipes]|nr:hypothetical protein TNCV_1054921 [Trichonephila clavipes]